MWLTILLTVWLIYAVFIIRFVEKRFTVGLRHIREENKEMAEKYDPFRRKDMEKWNHLEMYFVAVTLLPLRAVVFFSAITLCCLSTKLCLIGTHYTKDLSVLRRKLIKAAC